MDFLSTGPADELASLSRRIMTDRATPARLAEVGQSADGIDRELWRELAAAGILTAALPERAGGDGYDLAEQAAILTEAGRALAPVPYLESIVLGAGAIAAFGTDEQVASLARPAAAGDLVLTAALTEPGDGAPHQPSTLAWQVDGGWRLAGVKTTVPAGVAADAFLVPAATASGTAVFWVKPDDPGAQAEPQQLIDGPGAALLRLDEVTLPEDRLIGQPDGEAAGWLAARATVGICARQLGVTERALELTAEYARSREQFGRPIGAFQAVAQRLADAYIDVEAIRLTMWQAAWRLQSGLPCAQEIATAKFWAAEGGHRVAHTAVHVHGGVGIDLSHPLHRYFTAAKCNEFELGGATAQLRRLGASFAAS